MKTLKERILGCINPKELNSLRMLIVKDMHEHPENFTENQKAFVKMKNKFRRIPLRERPDDWKVYDPDVEQQVE